MTAPPAAPSCPRLHLAYADAVACGCMRGPQTEFERLLYGMRPITADRPWPVFLQVRLRVTSETDPEQRRTIVDAHRYLPHAPRHLSDEQRREFHRLAEAHVSWIEGAP